MGRNPRKGKKAPPWPSAKELEDYYWRLRNRHVKAQGCRCGGPSEWSHTVDGFMGGHFEIWTCAAHAGVVNWVLVDGAAIPLWPRLRPCAEDCAGMHKDAMRYYLRERAWFCTVEPSAEDRFPVPKHGTHSGS